MKKYKSLMFIANHQAPEELFSDYEIDVLLPEQKALWASIPKEGVKAHIAPIIACIEANEKERGEYDAIVVVGEPRACFAVVSALGANRCFSTYSVRESIDEPQADGSIKKTAVFRFDGLVPYEA